MSEQISWVSIFGAITGFAGLILHFWRFLQERPSINIYQPDDDRTQALTGFAEDPDEMTIDGHMLDVSTYHLWIWLRITNTSERPLTFLEFTLAMPGIEVQRLDSTTWVPKVATWDAAIGKNEYEAFEQDTVTPLVQPVFTLESYRATEGYFYFGRVDAETLKKVETARLQIFTTRKIFKKTIKINPRLSFWSEIQYLDISKND